MAPNPGEERMWVPFQQRLAEQVAMHTNLSAELGEVVTAYACCDLAIFSTRKAFAAKLANGHVVTWGDADCGGDISAVQTELKDVETIYSNQYAFAAKLANGRVVTWGDAGYGGDSSAVQSELKDVETIYSTSSAFAVKLGNDRVVTWGHAESGADLSLIHI